MNCSTHPDVAAVAFCRTCGKGLCAECRRVADGTVYCAEHAPGATIAQGTAYQGPSAPPVHTIPWLAFGLGLIPGVGAIYNGQYAKGLVHAVIFGLTISILNSNAAREFEALLGILLGVFVFYMAFEAYHTARRRLAGQPVDEFSSLVRTRHGHSSTGAVMLIIVGAVFLLNSLDIVELHQILKFWPALLILAGLNMLHSRVSERRGPGGES